MSDWVDFVKPIFFNDLIFGHPTINFAPEKPTDLVLLLYLR